MLYGYEKLMDGYVVNKKTPASGGFKSINYFPANLIEQPSALVSFMDTLLPAPTAAIASINQVLFTFLGFRALSSIAPR